MVPARRFELRTLGLKDRCSNQAELRRLKRILPKGRSARRADWDNRTNSRPRLRVVALVLVARCHTPFQPPGWVWRQRVVPFFAPFVYKGAIPEPEFTPFVYKPVSRVAFGP